MPTRNQASALFAATASLLTLAFAIIIGFASTAAADVDVTADVLLDIDPRVEYDRRIEQSKLTVDLENIGLDDIFTPIAVFIENITPASMGVLPANADGSEGGVPFYVFNANDGVLSPGETIAGAELIFDNPEAVRFAFDISAFGQDNISPFTVDLTEDFRLGTTRVRFNRRQDLSVFDAVLNNRTSENINAPVRLFIDSITPDTVTVANADGVEGGNPFFDFTTESGFIPANDKSEFRSFRFDNPDALRFTYTFSIFGANNAPTAEAGMDQTVMVGDMVTLDGSGSSDIDGDMLTFNWSLTPPDGSEADLDDPMSATPIFDVDLPGDYIAQLIVNDGIVDSAPDTVTISTINSAPVADAQAIDGLAPGFFVGDTITLDGSGSSDPDGDMLSFSWTLETPTGSSAVLSDNTAFNPTFTIDVFGQYIARLVVNDGDLNSAEASAIIDTANRQPIAEAGASQSPFVGDTVTLDGSGSSDPDGQPLSFAWSLTTVPTGSAAALSDMTLVDPQFDVDLPGEYVAQLIVNDGELDSAPDTVMINTMNSRPVADAGPDETVNTGALVQLDGSASSDVDMDMLTYMWSFTMRPLGSAANFDDNSIVDPTFAPDLPGTYIAQLVVNDGLLNSVADTVVITAEGALPTSIELTPDNLTTLTNSNNQFTVTLDNAAGPGGFVVDVAVGSLLSAPTQVTVLEGQTARNFTVQTGNDPGLDNVAVSAAGVAGDNTDVSIERRTFSVSTPFIGINRAITFELVLNEPAPQGGATFDLSLSDDAVATLSSPTVTFNQGQTRRTFQITGGANVAPVDLTVDGLAAGYTSTIENLFVSDQLIDVPASRELALTEIIDFQVVVNNVAPAGGLTIDLTSSDPSLVQVLTPQVVIPEGSFQAIAQIQAAGDQIGSTIVTASNAGFAPDELTVNVTAELNIVQSFSSFEESETDDVFVELISGGSSYPAPAGGVVVDLSVNDGGCASVPATVTVPEGSAFASFTLSYGGSTATACSAVVTADNALFGNDTVAVDVLPDTADIGTIAVSEIGSQDQRVGAGLTAQYRVTLSEAGHGGVTVQVEASDPNAARVGTGPAIPGNAAVELFIPDGFTTADFSVQGVPNQTGAITLNADAEGFAEGNLNVDIVETFLVIQQLDDDPSTLSGNDEFRVRTRIRNAADNGFHFQNVSGLAPLQVDIAGSDAAVAQLVTLTDSGQSVTIEIQPGTDTSPSTIVSGGPALDPLMGGMTTITATTGAFGTSDGSTFDITVIQPSITVSNLSTVGAGLQLGMTITLSDGAHGGAVVRVTSSDPTVALVAPNGTTAGSGFIDVFFPDGDTSEGVTIQGVSGAVGAVTITATEPRFAAGSDMLDIVQPALDLLSFLSTIDTLDTPDAFNVRTGVPNGAQTALASEQVVSAAAGPLNVTFTSDTPGVALVEGMTGGPAASIIVQIPVNVARSSTTLASGGSQLVPVSAGMATVTATAPGFLAGFALADEDVTVTTPVISISGSGVDVGAGLQVPVAVNLSASQHGGVSVTVTTDNDSIAVLSNSPTTAGSDSVVLNFPNGDSSETIYVQGVAGQAGTFTLTADTALFTQATESVNIVPAALDLLSLSATTTALSNEDAFQIRTGVPNSVETGLASEQALNPLNGDLTITISVSDATAQVRTAVDGPAMSVPVTLPVNLARTGNTVAAGGVALDPVSIGMPVVTATAPNFGSFPTIDTQTVTITGDDINLTDSVQRVGAGLQVINSVTLDSGNHGGVTITVTSLDPTIALVAPDATTPGSASIDIVFPDGDASENFYIQGVAGASGMVAITAVDNDAFLFNADQRDVSVAMPTLDFLSLVTATSTIDADDPFQVRTGILNPAGTALQFEQNVSAAAGPLTVTITSSDPTVGQLFEQNLASPQQTITVDIPVNVSRTPSSVSAGGAAFVPLTVGMTTIEASAPNFLNTNEDDQVIDVTPAIITVDNTLRDIGAGLQRNFTVTLSGPEHGGTTVRLTSSDPSTALVAPDANTAGSPFIDVFIADGMVSSSYTVQGVVGSTGVVTISATAAGFADNAADEFMVRILEPAFDILSLGSSKTLASADDNFQVRTGLPNSTNTALSVEQNVSAAAGTLTVTLNSSDPSVGLLVTDAEPAGDASVTVSIEVNNARSGNTVANSGPAFRVAGATGVTTIEAVNSDFTPIVGISTQTINVTR